MILERAVQAGCLVVLVAGAAVGNASLAAAAQPTQAQASAIRGSCRSDYQANCSSVPTGGSAALECLEKNVAKLSAACQQAVRAVMPAPAAAEQSPAPPSKTENAPEPPVSSEAPAGSQPAAGAHPAAAASPSPSPSPSPSTPTPKRAQTAGPSKSQAAAVKTACRADFPVHCPGVSPGGTAAWKCLQANAASLSKPCQQAVLGAGSGAGASASQHANTPPAAAAPKPVAAPAAAPVISIPPRQALFALRTACAGDVQSFCATVPLGGGRALACLGAHAASLSPRCRAALSLP